MCFAPQRRALFRHRNFQMARTCGAFNILTSKCASRPQRRSLFRYRNCNCQKWSGPCCIHFDFEICSAPRRALFRHLNFQKWSEREVFLAFPVANVLRATTACTFSTSQLPKVVRERCVLHILAWKCASRHNGVQFFISHLASWLRTPALANLLFDPLEPPIIGKTQCFATFLPFSASASSFF